MFKIFNWKRGVVFFLSLVFFLVEVWCTYSIKLKASKLCCKVMDFYSFVYVKSTLVGRLSEALCSLSDCLYKRPVVLGKQKRKWRSWRKMSAINAIQFPCISTKEDFHFWPVRNTWKCHSPLQITDLMLRLPLKSQFLFKMNVAPIVLCKKL